jgi:hypothetical protein
MELWWHTQFFGRASDRYREPVSIGTCTPDLRLLKSTERNPVNSPNNNPKPAIDFILMSVAYRTKERTVEVYSQALDGKWPGCWYALEWEGGGVIVSFTRNYGEQADATPILWDGRSIVIAEELAQKLAHLADLGVSRNFIDDEPVTVMGPDRFLVVGEPLEADDLVDPTFPWEALRWPT